MAIGRVLLAFGWLGAIGTGWEDPFRRIGEALLPGPDQVTILSCNVTSLEAHWDDLLQERWGCILVQESRVG